VKNLTYKASGLEFTPWSNIGIMCRGGREITRLALELRALIEGKAKLASKTSSQACITTQAKPASHHKARLYIEPLRNEEKKNIPERHGAEILNEMLRRWKKRGNSWKDSPKTKTPRGRLLLA
ncbi:hypothetical protein BgiBS90_013125, partial [Biomphalaria glabrata]